MSLAEAMVREHERNNKKCGCCFWYSALPKKEKLLFLTWVDEGLSLTALWRECRENYELRRGRVAFLEHLRTCDWRSR